MSRAEILEFLKTRKRIYKEILFKDNFLVIETNKGERFDIQEFGGVMHLGEITLEGNREEFKTYLNENEVVPSDKFSYALYGNQDSEMLKEKFKQRHKKAMQKYGRQSIKFQDGHKEKNPKADFYLFIYEENNIVYLGIATQSYDFTQSKKRDMQKPIRREALAISPRLSKILINLSGAKPHDKLLDPFCGIGVILAEALIKKINVYGIDKNKDAIYGAKINLKWITEEYKIQTKYTLENSDSRKAPDLQFSAIATETPLGKILIKKPSDNQATQMIQNFEAYIIPILKRLAKVKKPLGKIAITFPVIKNIHVDIQKITDRTNLSIYTNPILESRSDQFVSRDILVFQ